MDLLLKFPSNEVAVAFGQSLGVTAPDENGENVTATRAGDLTLHVIGEHRAPNGKTETVDGFEIPVLAPVPGWWVLARAPDDYPIPTDSLAAIGAEIVAPTGDPSIPNVSFL